MAMTAPWRERDVSGRASRVTEHGEAGYSHREPVAFCLLAANAVIAGAGGVLAKSLLEAGWSIGAVNLVRLAIAGGLLLPSTVWVINRGRVRIRGQLSRIVMLGVIGITGAITCYYNALARLPVGVALLLISMSPVLVLLWIWARHSARPRRTTVVGTAAAMSGLVLIVLATDVGTPSVAGIAWGLGAAFCLACYFVAADHMTTRMPPVTLTCFGLLVATATMGLLALVGLLPIEVGDDSVRLAERSVPSTVPLLLIAFFSTAFVFVAAFIVVEVLGARLASFFSLLDPIAAFLLAWALLGETPVPRQILGGVLILSGVALIRKDGSGRIKPDHSPDPFWTHPN